MTSEALEKLRAERLEEAKQFKMILLKDLPYFHRLYQKYHDPKALETAKNLGEYMKKIPISDV